MADPLPTLKGLRAFEEAYKHGSYTAAAIALNVQQPAISYQIKRLEEELGVELFIKERGKLVPTLPAKELFETLSHSFDSIRRVARRLRRTANTPVLTIATYSGIGTYWLSSRLPLLHKELAASTKVITLVKDTDLLREDSDCRIVFGNGQWPGVDSRLLIRERVSPVAAPMLAEQFELSEDGSVPKGISFIDQDDPENRWLGWEGWQRQVGSWSGLPKERTIVNDHGFALHLALAGTGVALAWLGVIEDLLEGGSLVRLSEHEATTNYGYWLIGRRGFFDTRRGQAMLKVLEHSDV